jgi:hypothetical protein
MSGRQAITYGIFDRRECAVMERPAVDDQRDSLFGIDGAIGGSPSVRHFPNQKVPEPYRSTILISSPARLLNRPQRERLSYFETRILVVNEIKLAVVTDTGERFVFCELQGVE